MFDGILKNLFKSKREKTQEQLHSRTYVWIESVKSEKTIFNSHVIKKNHFKI